MSQDSVILCGRQLHKGYGRGAAWTPVLRGAELAVARGEFVAIMGESGCGKSTLLHILGLMGRPDEGQVLIDGRDMTRSGEAERTAARREALGFVFQRFNLLGVLSAEDNIRLSLRIRGVAAGDGLVRDLLRRMGVGQLARRKCCRLSIGQQQRVAVARAIAHRPAILLADEPTGSLDSGNAQALLELLRQANREGQTVVLITHSLDTAGVAGRVLHMKDGQLHDPLRP